MIQKMEAIDTVELHINARQYEYSPNLRLRQRRSSHSVCIISYILSFSVTVQAIMTLHFLHPHCIPALIVAPRASFLSLQALQYLTAPANHPLSISKTVPK